MDAGRTLDLWLCVAAVLCLPCRSQGPSRVPEVRARLGGVAELECGALLPFDPAPAGPAPPLVVEWLRKGYSIPVLIQFGVHAPRAHPDYEGRVSLTQGSSLHVEGLRLEDEGWFECRILQLDRPAEESRNGSWTFLSVTAPPMFIATPPPSLEVLLGQPLSLTCRAHGNPPPTVTWRKGEAAVGQGLNGTLSFAAVTRETAGEYRCYTFNTEGELEHSTRLRVKGPPVIVTAPEDTAMNMSRDALLRCRAEADPPNMTYVWRKDGVNVYHADSLKSRVKILVDGTLLIHRLIPEDSGNYSCMPTNGLLTPPTAAAYLTVKHPAQTLPLPAETFLPTGMRGRISCPVRAEPPLLYIAWTKDGEPLDLDLFPGWTLDPQGSLLIATVNDNALGVYACTPYNSYGTMGQSRPTSVVLLSGWFISVHKPSIHITLFAVCQVDSAPRTPYSVAANGSLVLQPLSKDHQGVWECRATNRVATVSTGTQVNVLGTSPHAVTSVSVVPGIDRANVTWEPGFDGGYIQKFTVWLKQGATGRQEWTSLVVPPNWSSLLVTGLLPDTSYQFSVLPQNQIGTGPFSEIITVRTLAPLSDRPLVWAESPNLAPPTSLSANHSSLGVVLQWAPPSPQSEPISGYVLQGRRDNGEWTVLERDISANATEILVRGLLKDCSYELRMFSHHDELVGEPSLTVNVSTNGMEVYPARSHQHELIPEPLVAGVAGGVVFLCVGVLLSGLACAVRNRRKRRKRKTREGMSFHPQKGILSRDSPDSALKMKLFPSCSFNPGCSPSQSNRSSFDKASCDFPDQDQNQRLLSSPLPHYSSSQTTPGGLPTPSTALESISRGPDGRFILNPFDKSPSPTPEIERNSRADVITQSSEASSSQTSQTGSLKSDSPHSEKEQRKKTSPIFTVDLPISSGRVKAMARNFSHHRCFYEDQEQGLTKGLLERASFRSNSNEERVRDYVEHLREVIPSLGRQEKDLAYLPLDRENRITSTSTLVMQMEHERERGNLTKCLKLAREREELERELEQYTTDLRARAWQKEASSLQGDWKRAVEQKEPIWKLRDSTIPRKAKKGCYLGYSDNALEKRVSSTMCITQDVNPITSICSPASVQSPQRKAVIASQQTLSKSQEGDPAQKAASPVPKQASPSHLLPTSDTIFLLPEYGGPKENLCHGRQLSEEELQQSSDTVDVAVWAPKLGLLCKTQNPEIRSKSPKNSMCRYNKEEQMDSNARSSLKSSTQSSILEYLSLPGFVEMSVDEPLAEKEISVSFRPTLDKSPGTLLQREPDVVPKVWDVHAKDDLETYSGKIGTTLVEGKWITSSFLSSDLGPHEGHLSMEMEARNSSSEGLVKRWPTMKWQHSPISGQSFLDLGIDSGQPAPWISKDQEVDPSKCPSRQHELNLEQSQMLKTLDALPPRRCRPTVSFMNELISSGSNSTMPFIEVSGSVSKSPKKCVSSQEFLDPNVWIDSLSRGQATGSPFSSRPDTDLQIHRPEHSPRQHSPDPDFSKWPVPYQEALRSARHKPAQFRSSFSLAGKDYLRLPDAIVGPPKAFLPRGYSWPSRYHAPFSQGDVGSEVEEERVGPMELDEEIGDNKEDKEERDSFASQSSGRGSLGPASNHPIYPAASRPGSLDPPGESEGLEDDLDIQYKRSLTMRKVSVDESYEWDAADSCPESDVAKAAGGSAGGRVLRSNTCPRSGMSLPSKGLSNTGPKRHAFREAGYHTLQRPSSRRDLGPRRRDLNTASF
ncbi:hypothetical protein GN956_G23447 [Arapaima gigas]